MAASFLVSRLSSLGDVICTLPVVAALKDGFPDAKITWVVDPRFAGIVECCPLVDSVIRERPKLKIGALPKVQGEFDVALDMQGLLKSALIIATANAKRKVGYHWQREGSWLFSERIIPDPTSIHIVDQYVDVARAVGGIADEAQFKLEPHENDVPNVQAKLADAGVSGPYWIINPGAAWVTKRWPAPSFGAICDWLSERGIAPVLIGGPTEADKETARSVIEHCTKPVANLCGQTSVRELVALLASAKGHVGGDTGSSHLAAALGIPAIGLYSITKPARSCPYGQIQRCLYHADSLSMIPTQDVILELEMVVSA